MLETTVEAGPGGRTLQVRWKRGESVNTRTEATVTVDVVNLSAIAIASIGSGNITLDALNTPAPTLSISGSGDAALNALSTEELSVRIAGSGDVV